MAAPPALPRHDWRAGSAPHGRSSCIFRASRLTLFVVQILIALCAHTLAPTAEAARLAFSHDAVHSTGDLRATNVWAGGMNINDQFWQKETIEIHKITELQTAYNTLKKRVLLGPVSIVLNPRTWAECNEALTVPVTLAGFTMHPITITVSSSSVMDCTFQINNTAIGFMQAPKYIDLTSEWESRVAAIHVTNGAHIVFADIKLQFDPIRSNSSAAPGPPLPPFHYPDTMGATGNWPGGIQRPRRLVTTPKGATTHVGIHITRRSIVRFAGDEPTELIDAQVGVLAHGLSLIESDFGSLVCRNTGACAGAEAGSVANLPGLKQEDDTNNYGDGAKVLHVDRNSLMMAPHANISIIKGEAAVVRQESTLIMPESDIKIEYPLERGNAIAVLNSSYVNLENSWVNPGHIEEWAACVWSVTSTVDISGLTCGQFDYGVLAEASTIVGVDAIFQSGYSCVVASKKSMVELDGGQCLTSQTNIDASLRWQSGIQLEGDSFAQVLMFNVRNSSETWQESVRVDTGSSLLLAGGELRGSVVVDEGSYALLTGSVMVGDATSGVVVQGGSVADIDGVVIENVNQWCVDAHGAYVTGKVTCNLNGIAREPVGQYETQHYGGVRAEMSNLHELDITFEGTAVTTGTERTYCFLLSGGSLVTTMTTECTLDTGLSANMGAHAVLNGFTFKYPLTSPVQKKDTQCVEVKDGSTVVVTSTTATCLWGGAMELSNTAVNTPETAGAHPSVILVEHGSKLIAPATKFTVTSGYMKTLLVHSNSVFQAKSLDFTSTAGDSAPQRFSRAIVAMFGSSVGVSLPSPQGAPQSEFRGYCGAIMAVAHSNVHMLTPLDAALSNEAVCVTTIDAVHLRISSSLVSADADFHEMTNPSTPLRNDILSVAAKSSVFALGRFTATTSGKCGYRDESSFVSFMSTTVPSCKRSSGGQCWATSPESPQLMDTNWTNGHPAGFCLGPS